MVQLVGHQPIGQKVMGSIPGEGTCLGCGFSPSWGMYERQPINFSFSCLCFSLSFSLSTPHFRINFKKMSLSLYVILRILLKTTPLERNCLSRAWALKCTKQNSLHKVFPCNGVEINSSEHTFYWPLLPEDTYVPKRQNHRDFSCVFSSRNTWPIQCWPFLVSGPRPLSPSAVV